MVSLLGDYWVKLMSRRDEDFHKFNERGKEAEIMKSQYRQMEIRLESLERTQAEMDDNARSVGT
jgi:Tfp pilus assembly protein PilO